MPPMAVGRKILRLLGPSRGWKRRTLALGGGVVIAAGLALADVGKPDISGLAEQDIAIAVTPLVHFDRSKERRTRFGPLEWVGGAVLSARSKNFGGWSGLDVETDGRSFVAVSDAGTWLTGKFRYEGDKLAGIDHAKMGPLRALSGKVLSRNRDRDAEAVVLRDGTLEDGTLLLGFEQNDRVGVFPVAHGKVGAPRRYLPMPPEAAAMRMDGLETVAVLSGGAHASAVVALAERANRQGENAGWMWTNGKPKRFAIAGAGGFDLTDAKGLPDGSLLLLERRFRLIEGVRMRLSRVLSRDIRPGATIKRQVLAKFDMEQEIDNMEGMAVHRDGKGRTVVTLISDDNFNSFLQRTLLMQFILHNESTVQGAVRRSAAEAR